MIIFNGFQVIALVIFVIWLIVAGIKSGIRHYKEEKATGFCKHEWKLHNTHPFGNYADYKCNKCKTIRSRRM